MSDPVEGPRMIIMTSVLKQEGATIGRLGGNVTLPRPVPIKTLAAVLAGSFIGILLALPFSFGNVVRSVFVGAAFGGAAGAFLVTYSPWKGESMAKFLSTTTAARLRSMEVAGQRVTVAVGICPVDRVAQGTTHIIPGAVNIPESQYDERGVRISVSNRNLDRIRSPELAAMLLGDDKATGPTGELLPDEQEPKQSKWRRGTKNKAALSESLDKPSRRTSRRHAKSKANRPPDTVSFPGSIRTPSPFPPGSPTEPASDLPAPESVPPWEKHAQPTPQTTPQPPSSQPPTSPATDPGATPPWEKSPPPQPTVPAPPSPQTTHPLPAPQEPGTIPPWEKSR